MQLTEINLSPHASLIRKMHQSRLSGSSIRDTGAIYGPELLMRSGNSAWRVSCLHAGRGASNPGNFEKNAAYLIFVKSIEINASKATELDNKQFIKPFAGLSAI